MNQKFVSFVKFVVAEQTCVLPLDIARLFGYTWEKLGNKRSYLG